MHVSINLLKLKLQKYKKEADVQSHMKRDLIKRNVPITKIFGCYKKNDIPKETGQQQTRKDWLFHSPEWNMCS